MAGAKCVSCPAAGTITLMAGQARVRQLFTVGRGKLADTDKFRLMIVLRQGRAFPSSIAQKGHSLLYPFIVKYVSNVTGPLEHCGMRRCVRFGIFLFNRDGGNRLPLHRS